MIKIDPDGKRWTTHAPGADLDYSVDWTKWLSEGETIATSEWTASPGITMTRAVVNAGVATAFAGGGVDRQNYVITNKITTSGGRTDSRSVTLRCSLLRP